MTRLNVGNIRHPDGTDDNISLTSTGRVGIGTASPSQLLEINSASTPGVQIKDTTNNVIARIGANDNTALVGTRSNHPTVFQINDAEVARLDTSGNLQFNSGYGSVATAYGCRAWVNFNGTSTVAIHASGNVSSITDNGTGNYQMNFTNAMPDANYALVGTANDNVGLITTYAGTYSTTTAKVDSRNSTNGVVADWSRITVAVFR